MLGKKQIKKLVFIGLALLFIIVLIQLLVFSRERKTQELQKTIGTINTPYQINNHIYLESINVDSGNEIDLCFVLTDIDKSIFINENYKDSLYSALLTAIERDSNLASILKAKSSKSCLISDRNGQLLIQKEIR